MTFNEINLKVVVNCKHWTPQNVVYLMLRAYTVRVQLLSPAARLCARRDTFCNISLGIWQASSTTLCWNLSIFCGFIL